MSLNILQENVSFAFINIRIIGYGLIILLCLPEIRDNKSTRKLTFYNNLVENFTHSCRVSNSLLLFLFQSF